MFKFRLRRVFRNRPRLAIAVIFALGVALLLPLGVPRVTRVLIAWDAGVWLYLFLMAWLVLKAHHSHVSEIARQEYPSRLAELTGMSLAAIASVAAIIFELTALKKMPGDQRLQHYLFTGLTVFGSWCLITVFYALHYAHLFYTDESDSLPLEFSDKTPNPDYWDFLYFAFTIAVAAQTSDVMVVSRSVRKVVLAQSVLSFMFNVAIVGLSINMVAGIIGD